MRSRRLARLASPLLFVLLFGCDPYGREGEFIAGPVDAVNFPPEYLGHLGLSGNRLAAGQGTYVAARAFVGGAPLGHYLFSFPPAQLAAATVADPARPLNVPPLSPAVTFNTAYVFDPPGTANPFPSAAACQKPSPDYTYTLTDLNRAGDQALRAAAIAGDGINYSEQGNIFTQLPAVNPPGYLQGALPTTNYAPVVAETPVASNGIPCQSIKSEKTLQTGRATISDPDNRYLAWAVVDPSAGVYRYTSTGADAPGANLRGGIPRGGVGLQKWGWFNHYLLSYIDGGYIPVQAGRMVPQVLYLPDRVSTGNSGVGRGYDVLQAARTLAGGAPNPQYSPVCQIRIYRPATPQPVNSLPTTEAAILTTYGPYPGARLSDPGPADLTSCPPGSPAGSQCAIPRYIYCLQTTQ